MDDTQKANVTRLIEHYKALPELTSWSYHQCVAGVLKNLGIIDSIYNDRAIADALGIGNRDAADLVAGPSPYTWAELSDIDRRDLVVTTLEGILAEGDVDWGPPKI